LNYSNPSPFSAETEKVSDRNAVIDDFQNGEDNTQAEAETRSLRKRPRPEVDSCVDGKQDCGDGEAATGESAEGEAAAEEEVGDEEGGDQQQSAADAGGAAGRGQRDGDLEYRISEEVSAGGGHFKLSH